MGAMPTLPAHQRQDRQPTILHHSNSRLRNLQSLPTSMHLHYREKFMTKESLLSMRRILLITTVFSAFLLLRHIHVDVDLFRPLSLVPADTIIPGRSPLIYQYVAHVPAGQVDDHPAVEDPPLVPNSTSQTAADLPVRMDVSSEVHTDPPSDVPLSTATSQDSKELENVQHSNPASRDPADFSTFDNSTALNYFHMHKTGGVSFKERLFDFFIMNDTQIPSARTVNVFDTCHISSTARTELGIEREWSCDWDEIAILPKEARNEIDVIVGHQYWEHGARYWIPNRDMRYFTVMRHPLHRKISFFYHFFVRNAGRKEDSVTTDELVQFVLGKNLPESPLVRDAGPGYYASRLWSDGMRGYADNHRFAIPQETAASMVDNSIRRLRENFVFIGLQTQEPASLCMLKKTVEAFVKAHQLGDMKGLDGIAKQRERMNTGRYALSGKMLWERMNEEQRKEFRRVEKVDLGIYRESVKRFHEMVKRFGCEDLVEESDNDSVAL